jgi:hypothetical protein
MERTAADTKDPFHYEITFDGGEVLLHAIRQRPRTNTFRDAMPIAKLIPAAGQPFTAPAVDGESPISFVAKSPNHFLASWPVSSVEKAWQIKASSSTTPGRWKPLVAPSPQVGELHVDPLRGINLIALSESTGGQVLPLDGNWSVATSQPGGQRLLPLASWLFAAALLLFLVEITWRRRPAKPLTSMVNQ